MDEHQDQAELQRRHEQTTLQECASLRAGLKELHGRYRHERYLRPPFEWGVALFPQAWGGRWIWCATTSGGETVRVTGALLKRTMDHAMWREGAPAALYIVEDALNGALKLDAYASHLKLTHVVRRAREERRIAMTASLHVADPEAESLRFYAHCRPPSWPL